MNAPIRNFEVSCLLILTLLVLLPCKLAHGQTYQVLYSFHGGNDGATPYAGVMRDRAGNLYGATEAGGAFGNGVIFKLDTAGNETVLHSFRGSRSDGSQPYAALTADAAGNFYGTTYIGGRRNLGTVFQLDSAGNETVLHDFFGIAGGPQDGAAPFSKVLRDPAGNLYGTTLEGGSQGWGVVYKLDTAGRLTFVHDFLGPEGKQPRARIIRDNRGNFYGAAEFGGEFDFGVIYQIDASGRYTILHSFNDHDGSLPYGGVTRDDAGNVYGTTVVGGPSHQGVVFKLTSTGQYTVLHSFGGPEGAQPLSTLVRDSVGNLYGTTVLGGAANVGVVFKIDASGIYTVLHDFSGTDGEGPYADLMLDSVGNLYGTTYEGGDFENGVVFKIAP
jgi:uncharacterized repeat protein (TIGR03803 family)